MIRITWQPSPAMVTNERETMVFIPTPVDLIIISRFLNSLGTVPRNLMDLVPLGGKYTSRPVFMHDLYPLLKYILCSAKSSLALVPFKSLFPNNISIPPISSGTTKAFNWMVTCPTLMGNLILCLASILSPLAMPNLMGGSRAYTLIPIKLLSTNV